MTLHIFNDKTGVIHGADAKRIKSAHSGALSIGGKIVEILADEPAAVPVLCDGVFPATFKKADGEEYSLGTYNVRGGNIIPRQDFTAEEIRLRHRVDALEESLAELEASTTEEIEKLKNMFDTNALNFLIK